MVNHIMMEGAPVWGGLRICRSSPRDALSSAFILFKVEES